MSFLTDRLKNRFETDIVSHRGGRWYMDGRIAAILERLGYVADCSATPGISWNKAVGNRLYGTDYTTCQTGVCDLAGMYDITPRKILEIPMTITNPPPVKFRFPQGIKDLKSMVDGKKIWLRPNGHNRYNMLWIVDNSNSEYLEFMIHSSELMPGGSPTFKNSKDIAKMYGDIRALFESLARHGLVGETLGEFARNRLLCKI